MGNNPKFVMGIYDNKAISYKTSRKEKFQELTEFFTRFKYKGDIIVKNSINELLDEALDRGAEYCVIQSIGHLIKDDDFFFYIQQYIDKMNFFVTGHIMDRHSKNSAQPDGNAYYGLHTQCLLVNLKYYAKFDKPVFGDRNGNPEMVLAKAKRHAKDIHDDYTPLSLMPTEDTCICTPLVDGWNFINISLKNKLTVYNFHPKVRQTKEFVYPNKSIKDLENQLSWINNIISLAPNCVFLWNTEKYTDIKKLKLNKPVNNLYSVAASFKPNKILHDCNFTDTCTVNYFDYSRQALAFKKLLLKEWDGEDYPSFIQWAIDKYKVQETKGAGTETKSPRELWEREISWWGSSNTIKEHWYKYKSLEHTYTHVNIYENPSKIIDRIEQDNASVIWWSNAFHTVSAHYTLGLKGVRNSYTNWLTKIYEKNPEMYILGTDYLNNSINNNKLHNYLHDYKSQN